MRSTLKTLLALGIAAFAMLLFRALAFTIYDVPVAALEPVFQAVDRVMVNRWSYGLRVGDGGLMAYNRLWRQPVRRGDLVAVNDPTDTLESVSDRRVLILRCVGVPGDTVTIGNCLLVVPGRSTCADGDYYWMLAAPRTSKSAARNRQPEQRDSYDSRTFGLVREDHIIGRAFLIIYSHDPDQPLWAGWNGERLFLPPQ